VEVATNTRVRGIREPCLFNCVIYRWARIILRAQDVVKLFVLRRVGCVLADQPSRRYYRATMGCSPLSKVQVGKTYTYVLPTG
jgi:hypothetical protein